VSKNRLIGVEGDREDSGAAHCSNPEDKKTRRRTGGLDSAGKWLAERQANALGMAALSSTACG
jgi:hypothetical protein